MFFDISGRKLVILIIIVVGVLAAVGIFIAANNAVGLTARSGEIAAMEEGQLMYLFEFKLPSLLHPQPTPALASGNAIGVPVLLYHGEGSDSTAMPLSVFVPQLRALYEAGWHTITYQQFLDFMKYGTPVPAKSFLLTFDDGRRDTYYSADPVLADLHFTAVMFVITGFSLPNNANAPVNNFYLSKAELVSMQQSGRWQIESHGNEDHRLYTVPTASSTVASLEEIPEQHFLSNEFWLPEDGRIETAAEFDARVTADLLDSRSLLEKDFSTSVTGFAYPFNDYGEDTANYPGSQAGLNRIVPDIYSLAFYQVAPGDGDTFNYPEPGAYMVKRIEPPSTWTGADLIAALNGGIMKSLPYSATTFGSDWASNWGTATSSLEGLWLGADPDSTGAAAYLNGTNPWRDYTVTATFVGNYGTVSLIARHTQTDNPYLVCAFSGDKIYLEEHQGESQTTVAEAPYALPNDTHLTVSMTVNGNTASCNAYGATVRGSAMGIGSGGVGVDVWDPEDGAASTTLSSISVVPVSP